MANRIIQENYDVFYIYIIRYKYKSFDTNLTVMVGIYNEIV